MSETKPLRLLAQDADDLDVISAAVQDAVLKIGDIDYEPKAKRLTVALNRYRWEAGGGEREDDEERDRQGKFEADAGCRFGRHAGRGQGGHVSCEIGRQ